MKISTKHISYENAFFKKERTPERQGQSSLLQIEVIERKV